MIKEIGFYLMPQWSSALVREDFKFGSGVIGLSKWLKQYVFIFKQVCENSSTFKFPVYELGTLGREWVKLLLIMTRWRFHTTAALVNKYILEKTSRKHSKSRIRYIVRIHTTFPSDEVKMLQWEYISFLSFFFFFTSLWCGSLYPAHWRSLCT